MTPFTRLRRPSGFTLIELMIAVAVVGILAAVAYPSFMDSIRKGRRSEAFSLLSSIQQAQERWRANNASYATDLTSAPPTGLGQLSTTPGGYYTVALANVTATGYDVVATAVSGKSQASDGTCTKLAVRMAGGNVLYASSSLSYAATNSCWAR